MNELLIRLLETHSAGKPVVMATLVETRGSTPQKAGARMLVFADGSQLGTLGGGCVEAEVKRQSLDLMLSDGKPSLLVFDLDKDYGWDDGLICGGRMTMLVDPVRPADSVEFYVAQSELMLSGSTEVTLLKDNGDAPAGTRYLFDANGQLASAAAIEGSEVPQVPDTVTQHLRPVKLRPRPYVEAGISYIPQLPRVPLYIVGAGHVGQQVAAYAAQVDFDVTVIDDRETYCSRDRFPAAKSLLVGPMETVLTNLDVPECAYCIVVTRGHQHDEEALFHLIQKPHTYLGMIGSKRKIRLIFDDLLRQGIAEEKLQQVHAPIGIEIGSQTVPEIAISIVAELISYRNLPR